MSLATTKLSQSLGKLTAWNKSATGITGKTDHSYFKIEPYRFVQPIANYDPVNSMPEGTKISSLNYGHL